MSNALGNVFAAELRKLATHPAAQAAIVVTVLATPALAWAAGLVAVDYGQLGLVVLGLLTTAGEYSGRQIRTSLLCVPDRTLLLSGKVLAYLALATPAALLTGTLSVVAAKAPVSALPGSAAYLVLIGLLGLAAGLLLRSLAGTAAALTGFLFVASPLLAAVTDLADHLPDRAGASLYRAGALPAWHGGAVLVVWLVIALGIAAVTFAKRDA